ncbi:MAG: C1 family peptidase, partial [Bacteroidota bacterium]
MKSLATILAILLCWAAFGPTAMASDSAAPPSWENTDGIPPVGNQVVGGSCFAWAAAYYYLTHLQWQEYGWDVNDPAHQCSPAFIYNLTNGGVDNGANEGFNARADAFRVFETMGCATMADMPYDYRGYRTFPTEQAFRNGMRFRTLSTHQIATRTDSGLQVLKDHLAGGNLAVMGIFGYRNFDNINSYNNTYCVSQTAGGRLYWHEIAVVGYDDSMLTADGYGAFRLVNSFGTGWGDNGYFWMSYAAVKATKTSYGYVLYATDRIGHEPMLTARVDIGHDDRYNLIYRVGLGETTSPDTLLTFFNFNPMRLSPGIPYPDGAFVLDISDMKGLLQTGGRNKIFLRVENKRPGMGYDGGIRSLMVEDLSGQLCAPSNEIPIDVLDASVGAEVSIDLDYSNFPPQTLDVDVDSASGLAQASWGVPAQGAGLTGYRIYIDGRLIDSTSALTYTHYLSLRGTHHYGVSAVFSGGESPAGMETVEWAGPTAYGIPYADGFEGGFGGWYHVGSSGVPLVTVEDPVHEGDYSAGIRTNPSGGYAVLIRPFGTVEGAEVETWVLLEAYPDTGGAGGSLLLAMDGWAFGTFANEEGHPGFLHSSGANQLEVLDIDTTITINRGEWYKQKIWYHDGKCQIMVLNDEWNVVLNEVVDMADVSLNQVAFFAEGMNNGPCYYDRFSIRPWTSDGLQHFSPVAPTEAPYALLIGGAQVDTAALEAGDEIAIYDGALCVGGAMVDGEWPLEMNAFGADSSDPGFTPGNAIEARIWRHQSNVEYETDLTFVIGDGTFGHGLFSRITLEGTMVVAVHEEPTVPLEFAISEP